MSSPMEVVVINRSNRKAGLMLMLLGLIIMSPFLVYFQNPFAFSLGFKNQTPLQVTCIALVSGLILAVGVFFSRFLLKMLFSKTVALELSEKGIRYNATGRSEQFIPVEDIYGATLGRTGNGSFSALLVLRNEGREAHLNTPVGARILKTAPAMRIWHELLDGSPEAIADTINKFFNIAKTVEQPEIYVANKNNNAYVPVVIGLSLILLGFVIPFASVPLWIGLSAGVLVISLGSIILTASKDNLVVAELPVHVSKTIKRGVKTLFSGFTAPIPTVPNRIAGAIVYSLVGTTCIYFILPHVLCSQGSCEKDYIIPEPLIFPVLASLFVVGYGMGIGVKK